MVEVIYSQQIFPQKHANIRSLEYLGALNKQQNVPQRYMILRCNKLEFSFSATSRSM